MKRRDALETLALVAAAWCIAAGIMAPASHGATPPNIILILTDDHGWNHVSYRSDPDQPNSSSDFIETPNLARAAKRGIRFTDAYAPNPICSPTRHSMLFGQNAARHVYAKSMDWLADASGWLTIPKAIKQANSAYRTAHFGKWHVGLTPQEIGFDYSDGITNNSQGEFHHGVFKNSRSLRSKVTAYNKAEGISVKPPGYSKQPVSYEEADPKAAFSLALKSEAFIRESVADRKPFFAYIAHYAAHLDLVSTGASYEYFKNKKKGSRHDNAAYAAMVKDLDTAIGRTLDLVEELGIGDNTYIFITGDNGGVQNFYQSVRVDESNNVLSSQESDIEWRNLPLRQGKHEFYEGGIRVPFIALGPGISGGSVSRSPVSGLDFLPTFAALAGGSPQPSPAVDGDSIASVLIEPDSEVVRESDSLIFHQGANRTPISAIRKGNYKLIKHWMAGEGCKYCGDHLLELYDLSQDIGEAEDLADRLPELTRALDDELMKFLAKANAETELRPRKDAYNVMLEKMGIDENAIEVNTEYVSPFED